MLNKKQRLLIKKLHQTDPDYTVEIVDGAECIYRNLGFVQISKADTLEKFGNVDIEITGGAHNRKFNIYVWLYKNKIIERYLDLSSKEPFVDVFDALYKISGHYTPVKRGTGWPL